MKVKITGFFDESGTFDGLPSEVESDFDSPCSEGEVGTIAEGWEECKQITVDHGGPEDSSGGLAVYELDLPDTFGSEAEAVEAVLSLRQAIGEQ